ncbi:MAG: phosphatidate cytidylyltransferase [Clostridia bacterium]|nr:phosphatidate cytidylyltransferase [Clostridia bacterium]
MKTRIITGIFLVLLLFVPSLLLMDTIFLPIVCSLLCIIGVHEMLCCIGRDKHLPTALPTYALALISPLAARFLDMQTVFLPSAIVIVVLSIMYTLSLSVFIPDKYNSGDTAQAFLLCTYVIAGFTAIELISVTENAKFVFPMIYIGAFVTDTFCYFTGMIFGKHKLIPRISPKKTIEGSVGGTVASVFAFLLYGYVISLLTDLNANYFALALTGFVLAIVSQIGDLVASAVKRNYGIKDYGKLFPGHGGVMDRFDSLIAVAALLSIIGTQMQISLFK